MTEMTKLREALDAAGIKWEDKSDNWRGLNTCCTVFMNKNEEYCSVSYCKGISYGWQAGLLEIWPPICKDDGDNVEGWLTADEIIKAWV